VKTVYDIPYIMCIKFQNQNLYLKILDHQLLHV